MLLDALAVIAGLVLLLWSADRFVESAASLARAWGMSALLIGMLIVGFGTSAPEMLVSATAALEGNPSLAIGNAYGSNITNIGLILGITALIRPMAVSSGVLRRELPVLAAVTGLAAVQLIDGELSRLDSALLLLVFAGLVGWSIRTGRRGSDDALAVEVRDELEIRRIPARRAWPWLILGLAGLILSARMLVLGAVGVAQTLGISDLVIGLTVVAVGTSLPELASSLIAARKGEHEIALGNVVGSNLFNTLAVVGIAGMLQPFAVDAVILQRDVAVMGALTLGLLVFGRGFRGLGRLNRIEGGALIAAWIAYTGWLLVGTSAA